MKPVVTFEVYKGTMSAGKLKFASPDADKCREFVKRFRSACEQNPNGWRGDITLVRLYDGKRERLTTYRRPRGEVGQIILRLMETIHGDRSNQAPSYLPSEAIQRHDGLRSLRASVGR